MDLFRCGGGGGVLDHVLSCSSSSLLKVRVHIQQVAGSSIYWEEFKAVGVSIPVCGEKVNESTCVDRKFLKSKLA